MMGAKTKEPALVGSFAVSMYRRDAQRPGTRQRAFPPYTVRLPEVVFFQAQNVLFHGSLVL